MSWSNFLKRELINPQSNKKSCKSVKSKSILSSIGSSPLDQGRLIDQSQVPKMTYSEITLNQINQTLKDLKVITLKQNKSMNKIMNRMEMKSCEHFKKSREIKTSNKKSATNTIMKTNKKEISQIELKIKQFDKMKKEFEKCMKTVHKSRHK